VRATGRLISWVEAGGRPERAVAKAVFPHTGRAWLVGVTGAPGVGKSTLIDGLVERLRAASEQVAVVAVDPSSPDSGGAFLGDRVRFQRHATDPGVFVRSMASRGQTGGLARGTVGAARVLDAAGWPWVVVETAGVGQVALDVADAVDTTVVVVTPGWGDSIQAAKAGLLEVADVFAVNKADLPGAGEAARQLEASLDPEQPDGWRRPVVQVVAGSSSGTEELWSTLLRHRAWLAEDGRLGARRARRLAREVCAIVTRSMVDEAADRCRGPAFDRLVGHVADRRLDPLAAAVALLRPR
jgi:LAO/AO transport system kinase